MVRTEAIIVFLLIAVATIGGIGTEMGIQSAQDQAKTTIHRATTIINRLAGAASIMTNQIVRTHMVIRTDKHPYLIFA